MASFTEAFKNMGKYSMVGVASMLDDFVTVMNARPGIIAGDLGAAASMTTSHGGSAPASAIAGGAAGRIIGIAALSAMSTGLRAGASNDKASTEKYISNMANAVSGKGKKKESIGEGKAAEIGQEVFGSAVDPEFYKAGLRTAFVTYNMALESYQNENKIRKQMKKHRRQIMREVADTRAPDYTKRFLEGQLRMQEKEAEEAMHLQRLAADITPILGQFAGGGPGGPLFGAVKGIVDSLVAKKRRRTQRRRRKRAMDAFHMSFEESVDLANRVRGAINRYRARELEMSPAERINHLLSIKEIIPTDDEIDEVLPWLLPRDQDFILSIDMLVDLYGKAGNSG